METVPIWKYQCKLSIENRGIPVCTSKETIPENRRTLPSTKMTNASERKGLPIIESSPTEVSDVTVEVEDKNLRIRIFVGNALKK